MAQIEGYIIHETRKAYLFHGHYWEEPMWLPKSAVLRRLSIIDEYEQIVIVKDWLTKKEKIEEFKYRVR